MMSMALMYDHPDVDPYSIITDHTLSMELKFQDFVSFHLVAPVVELLSLCSLKWFIFHFVNFGYGNYCAQFWYFANFY